MLIFLTQMFYLVFFLVILFVLLLLLLWSWSSITNKTPFIPVPESTLKDIEKALDLKDGSVVYDLGCGDGRVLFYLYKNNKKAKYFGIEKAPFPLLLARFSKLLHRREYEDSIELIKEDFFKTDLSKATHIFTYLYPNIMDDLLPKFDKELKPGTRLVSMSFHFTNLKESSLIDLKREGSKRAKQIYVYDF